MIRISLRTMQSSLKAHRKGYAVVTFGTGLAPHPLVFGSGGPRELSHTIHSKRGRREFYHAPMHSLAGGCTPRETGNTKIGRIYEKTSFTSIGSNRTGSGAGKTGWRSGFSWNRRRRNWIRLPRVPV